jgi:hypothetical protein
VILFLCSPSETAVASEPSGLSFLDHLPRPSSAPFEDDPASDPELSVFAAMEAGR